MIRRLLNRIKAYRQSRRIEASLQRSHWQQSTEAWEIFEQLGIYTEQGFYRFDEFEKDYILRHVDPHRYLSKGICSCGASGFDLLQFGRYPCPDIVARITQEDFYDIRNGGTKLMEKTEGEVLLRFV